MRREKKVYYLSGADIIYGMDVFIVAKNKTEAVNKFAELLRQRIADVIENITDDLDDEEYQWYIESEEEIIEED